MSLDDDLAAWAATVRLPDGRRRRDLRADRRLGRSGPAAPAAADPPPRRRLDPSWWRGYNAGFAARMVASTAPVRLAA